MKRGQLKTYFSGILAKRLSAVEVHPEKSNQHEFNGTTEMKQLFSIEKKVFDATLIYLGNEGEDRHVAKEAVTWYDAREKIPDRSEHRLYFPSTLVTEAAHEGDLLIICLKPDQSLLIIIVQASSTVENQLFWLFGIDSPDTDFIYKDFSQDDTSSVSLVASYVLETLGIEIVERDDDLLEFMLEKFGGSFPRTFEFSEFARGTVPDVSSLDDADTALVSWMEQEELLFRTLEYYIVGGQLKAGFGEDGADVNEFIKFSLSVQNRRKSRAGYALENHLETIFRDHKIRFDRGKATENKSKPDFLFPGIFEYLDDAFPKTKLTMLGSKSTCKDRWRQVLSEATKIPEKHLLTLEPAISESQTNEMRDRKLQLVVPTEIQSTYSAGQQDWLLDLKSFISLVQNKSK